MVTMVTDTFGLGDQNFNDLAKRGLDRAVEELSVQGEVIESRDAASYIPNLTQARSRATSLSALDSCSPRPYRGCQSVSRQELPPHRLSRGAECPGRALPREEGAFLSGVLAGLMTESNQLGVVGGVRSHRWCATWSASRRAKSVNPDVDVVVAYADTFGDPALGKELTLAQYNQGVDIAFPVAGATGIGSFEAAKELGGALGHRRRYGSKPARRRVPARVSEKGVDTRSSWPRKQVVEGTFEGGEQSLGLAEDGVGLGTRTNRCRRRCSTPSPPMSRRSSTARSPCRRTRRSWPPSSRSRSTRLPRRPRNPRSR